MIKTRVFVAGAICFLSFSASDGLAGEAVAENVVIRKMNCRAKVEDRTRLSGYMDVSTDLAALPTFRFLLSEELCDRVPLSKLFMGRSLTVVYNRENRHLLKVLSGGEEILVEAADLYGADLGDALYEYPNSHYEHWKDVGTCLRYPEVSKREIRRGTTGGSTPRSRVYTYAYETVTLREEFSTWNGNRVPNSTHTHEIIEWKQLDLETTSTPVFGVKAGEIQEQIDALREKARTAGELCPPVEQEA